MITYRQKNDSEIEVVDVLESIVKVISIDEYNSILNEKKNKLNNAEEVKQDFIAKTQGEIDAMETFKTELLAKDMIAKPVSVSEEVIP